MLKIRIVVLLICILTVVGCTEKASTETEAEVANDNEAQREMAESDVLESESKLNGEVTETIQDDSAAEVKEDEIDADTLETIETETASETKPDTPQMITVGLEYESVDEKVAIAIERDLPIMNSELDLIRYTPDDKDTLQYLSQNSSLELSESLSHKGFVGIEVVYERSMYQWDEFFGDLDVDETKRTITVALVGDSIFESDFVDEYEKYYRYYDEHKGLYYEVQDLMMGNFTDEDAVLTNKQIGMVCNYGAMNVIQAPTYNPLIIEPDATNKVYYITSLDDRPCLFVQYVKEGKLHQEWIDIEYGLLVQSYIFDEEGLILDVKKATSIVVKDIPQATFDEPKDIDYSDITMFIYSMEGGKYLSEFYSALVDLLPETPFGMTLASENNEINIYSRGLKEGMMGELGISDPMYVKHYTDDKGTEMRIREISDGRFYTIHDGLKMVEIYDKSCYEKYFFDFASPGLLSITERDDATVYAFYSHNNISVSALYDVYAYVVKGEKILAVETYAIDAINNPVPVTDVNAYSVKIIDFDETIYDDTCMDTYEIVDHGEGSFNDGESRPFWVTE